MISQSHRTTITEQTGILVTEILQIPFSPRLLPDSSHPGVFQVIKPVSYTHLTLPTILRV